MIGYVNLESDEFLERATAICEWFTPLNPYVVKGPLLKIEDENYGIENGKLTPLYCVAVSAKRNALFNIDVKGKPVLRKASAHGLGHLMPPYEDDKAPDQLPAPIIPLSEIGVRRWQHDLWCCIIQAALSGNPDQVDLSRLPGLDNPAISQYRATTPDLLGWFNTYNTGKSYSEQVRPFGFLLALQAVLSAFIEGEAVTKPAREKLTRPVAPFTNDPAAAVGSCFDRLTGIAVHASLLKTYERALAQYHLHPEGKFLNGGYSDRGATRRRHVEVTLVDHIGKEANRWEQQAHLGVNPEFQVVYGVEPDAEQKALEAVRQAARRYSVSAIAREAGLSRQYVSEIAGGKRNPSVEAIDRLVGAVRGMDGDY